MNPRYKVGQEVIVNTKEISEKKGVIRFIGKIQGKTDEYIGVQLDQPCGKNNGDVDGKPYFKVQKKSEKGSFGVFVKAVSIKAVPKGPRPSRAPQPPPSQGRNKLSNQLMEQQSSEVQNLKDELEACNERIRAFEELDSNKEIESLKGKVKEYQEINRTAKLELDKVRYRTDQDQEAKLKELAQRLEFFKSQKESVERQRSELKKKIQRLEAEIEEGAEKDEMLETLTFKIEGLEAKNDKMKGELEAANTQLKNAQILGSSKGNEQLEQNISTLNEMISLLESDLSEEKEKSAKLETQLEQSAAKMNEAVRLERKLKSREEELQTMKIQLEAFEDAAAFVQKLTLDLLTKEEAIREQTKKLKQFSESTNKLETELSESNEMVTLQSQEMQSLEDEIQKMVNEKAEQQKHISLLNDQISKYKQKIRELSDNNSSLLMNIEDREDDNVIQNYFNVDVFQHKYYQLAKLHQASQEQALKFQLNMASIRHSSGIFLSNIYQTLPQTFTGRLYPNLMNLLLKISGTSHNLYLLFEVCSEALTHKSELYSAEQQNIAGWLLLLLQQIPELYSSLFKIELAITSADSQSDISQIIGHPQLKNELTRINVFTQQLLERIITQTIDIEIPIDPYTDPIDMLDQLSASIERMPTQLATRHELCVQTMKGVHQILSSIELYRRNSEARQTSQIDILLQNFLKLLEGYMRECCTNPHIRLKTDMKSFISGVDLITKILKEIELNDNLQELSSLYSETEDIKMLKETIMTTQFHLKQLQKDLEQISYPTPLSRVHVRLPGKIWQDKLTGMRDELLRFESTLQEKNDLEQTVAEQKKKILLLEKEIKDRIVTKELHQRRIGELQLKVEQAAFLESDFKRQSEKLASLEEASKIIEDELGSQSKKKKQLEEQLRKTKEKFDIFQTETMMKQKKLKSSANLSSEDISSLSIFKSVISQAGSLRNHSTKVKLHELKFSKIAQMDQAKAPSKSNRRQILTSLMNLKVQNPEVRMPVLEMKEMKKEGKGGEIAVGKALARGVEPTSMLVNLTPLTLFNR